jgi:pantoate--beta-alanine ligase
MRVVRSVGAMQRRAMRWKAQGRLVGLVPTMGYLHEGHLSLVRRARQCVGARGVVVVSIYVNPTQFAPGEDLARYPRDFARDRRLCREARVDAVFVPCDAEMYPGRGQNRYSTHVVEEQLSKGMEGTSRPTHFRGVTTVVAKLFNIVLPDVAVFGAKDFQQAAVIRRMVRDLNFPVKVLVAPTVREPDGLAMSSRNQYLTGGLRTQAVVLSKAIQQARQAIRTAKDPLPATPLKGRLRRFIERQPDARVDYLAFFDPETFESVKQVAHGTHLALAVFLGKTRLIDNARL